MMLAEALVVSLGMVLYVFFGEAKGAGVVCKSERAIFRWSTVTVFGIA
jgi:hypothetical protein